MATTQAQIYTVGTDGQVRNRTASADVILASITGWELNKPVVVVKALSFGSPANANGVVFPYNAYATTGDWSFSVTGLFNLDNTAGIQTGNTGMSDGARVIMDFVVSKSISYGYPLCYGIIKDFKSGQKVDGGMCLFSCTLDGYGVPPAYGAVSVTA